MYKHTRPIWRLLSNGILLLTSQIQNVLCCVVLCSSSKRSARQSWAIALFIEPILQCTPGQGVIVAVTVAVTCGLVTRVSHSFAMLT